MHSGQTLATMGWSAISAQQGATPALRAARLWYAQLLDGAAILLALACRRLQVGGTFKLPV
jgi:hypothetical protein